MKYLFYISKIYSIPIIIPIVKYLEQTGREYRFYLSDKVKNAKPDSWKNEFVLNSVSETKKFNADFVLCPGNFVDFRIPGIKVQLFHGLGVEKDVHYKIRHFFDIYLTSGPFVTHKYVQMQKEHNYFLVLETGWPKIDYILNYSTENIREKYNIPARKKVILYAPTFSTKHESASALLKMIPNLINKDTFWLFKFHELMDKELIEPFTKLSEESSKVIVNEEITPYLHAADVMISDTSSVVYEFMALQKPVITYKTQSREDKGYNISNPEELPEAIEYCLTYSDIFKEKSIKHLKEINPYLDGKISQTLVEKLELVKRENLMPKYKKPLNLFRKSQLMYHSMFKKGYLR